MELMDAIRKRRAIRKYRPDPVPAGMLEQIIEAARLAPSGVNSQPWKFKVVTDKETKKKIFEASKNQRQIDMAPAVIVICGDSMSYHKGLKERFRQLVEDGVLSPEDLNKMGLADLMSDDEVKDLARFDANAAFNTAIATEHMTLMAASLGLGSCWVHLFDKDAVAKLFGLPPWIKPVTLLTVGYADEDPEPKPRKGVAEITF